MWEAFITRIYMTFENLTLSAIIEVLSFVGGSSCCIFALHLYFFYLTAALPRWVGGRESDLQWATQGVSQLTSLQGMAGGQASSWNAGQACSHVGAAEGLHPAPTSGHPNTTGKLLANGVWAFLYISSCEHRAAYTHEVTFAKTEFTPCVFWLIAICWLILVGLLLSFHTPSYTSVLLCLCRWLVCP